MEELHKAGCSGDLDIGRDAQLTFEATTPGVQVTLVGEDEGVELSTSDLNDALVTQGFQNHGLLSFAGASVSSNAVLSKPVAENITITGQVEGVFLTATDLLQTAHVVSLLSVGEATLQVGACVALGLLLLPRLLLFLGSLLPSSILPQCLLVHFGFVLATVLRLLLVGHRGGVAVLLAELHAKLAVLVGTSPLLGHTRATIFVADVVLGVVKSV